MKTLRMLGLAIGLAVGANASAATVGGINFGSGVVNLDTTTLAETIVTAAGQTLTGYGQVNTVNGNSSYCATAGCRLFFEFTYNTSFFGGSFVQFDSGSMNVYLDPTGASRNLLSFSSVANLAHISAGTLGTPWLTLAGHSFAPSLCTILGGLATQEICATNPSLGSVNASFTGTGLLDVVGGDASVMAFMDTNTKSDGLGGFADITLTSSGTYSLPNSNTNDPACGRTPVAGQFCIDGSASLTNPVKIPEPGSLALFGIAFAALGLRGLGRNKSAV